jgi:hypothetical protein
MPPERYGPPPRPSRDRHTGPGGPRRSFGPPGGGGGHGGPPRDNRPLPPRPPFGGDRPGGPGPGFAPGHGGGPHTVRLREGEREVEVTGPAEFVRQTLDDLPALFARLRGEAAPPPGRPASISMPPPPAAQPAHHEQQEDDDEDELDDAPPPKAPKSSKKAQASPPPAQQRANGRVGHGKNGRASLEDRVFDLLGHADHPLSVASIRKQLGGAESGQQIRRILERAGDRVYSTDERPAAYALR